MDLRFGLALAALLSAALAPPAAADTPRRLFVYGDSFAVGTKPFLPDALPRWRVKQDVDFTRPAQMAPPALRELGDRLAPVIHLSLGTVDDPARPRRYRRAVRRTMRVVGTDRCVVWANVYRPAPPGQPKWERLNEVLDEEAAKRDNLIIVDWYSMVSAHLAWANEVDGTHVNEHGYRVRSRMVADGVRDCHARLASDFSTNSKK